ncbi:MAG: DUF3667 domain-containing protein [Chitinophagaceae bacterium]|nr:DUF3667 domain-containing protein [Chitinophagaceae bacterium]
MSHIPQRKEKDCLNCGSIVQGKYCHVCGQENVVPKETFWHMVTHFFYDITHFDSSFFTTIKDLLFKPGFLSKEYMKGRRVSYLHPIRMYVFTSAIFFLLFFSFFGSPKVIVPAEKLLSVQERATYIRVLKEELTKDSTHAEFKGLLLLARDTSSKLTNLDMRRVDTSNGGLFIDFRSKFKTFGEYDSAQKKLPSAERDGWLKRRLMRFSINVDRKFRDDPEQASKKLLGIILHRLPYMLLISLPFFALILKLVYIRRKNFYYADHGVFTIHLYVFSFLMLLLVFTIDKLGDVIKSELPDWLILICILTLFFYLYKAMRNFYGQRRLKTFLKFSLVALLSLIMMVVLFILIAFFSAATL